MNIFKSGFLSLVLLACSACNTHPTDQPETGTVTGVVTLDGKPLDQATVKFQPDSGRFSTGTTDAAGHYELKYDQTTKGAKLGHHSVSITTFRNLTDPTNLSSPPYAETLPPKYHTKSQLVADIKPGANEVNFELESK